ncbi:hypothetical protein H0H87_002732, partial [Tephrocybe sp. NHM501043]
MPSLDIPEVPHYVHAPVTKVDLDYADLPVIDLSKASSLEGRVALSIQVREAMVDHGFFYVINHGYTTNEVGTHLRPKASVSDRHSKSERIFDIANVPFEHVTSEEKTTYAGTMKDTGSYQGYKSRQYW